jgi:hypothetical protein
VEFTVQLRYKSGSQTVLSIDAESADDALQQVRDQRRLLVGINITAPSQQDGDADEANVDRRVTFTPRRIPVAHRPSRRRH